MKHLKEALRGRDARITALEDSLRAYELEEGGERTTQETVRQAEGAAGARLGRAGEVGRREGGQGRGLAVHCVVGAGTVLPAPTASAPTLPLCSPAAERDELRASMQELLGRLSAANSVIGTADESIHALEARLEAAAAERQQAQEEAAAARDEAEGLRETVADLQVGLGEGSGGMRRGPPLTLLCLLTPVAAVQRHPLRCVLRPLQFRVDLLQQLSDLTLQQNDEKTATLRALLQSESMLDAAGAGGGASGGLLSSSDSEDGSHGQ